MALRHFAATQQFGRFRNEADIQRAALAARINEYATYLEKDRTEPTMKQKVRFIFKARDQGATVGAVPPQSPSCMSKDKTYPIRLTRSPNRTARTF
jgi:hypothetical protein